MPERSLSFALRIVGLNLCMLTLAHPAYGQQSINSQTAGPADLAAYLSEQFPGAPQRYIQAFGQIPRHAFLPERLRPMAYRDIHAPLYTEGILPSPSSLMEAITALSPAFLDRILVVGADIGYTVALLSRLSSHVYGIELDKAAFDDHAPVLSDLGFSNITYDHASDPAHFEEMGPFSRIFLHAAVSRVPESIFHQMADPGTSIFPMTSQFGAQLLMEVVLENDEYSFAVIGESFFAPTDVPAFGP